MRKTRRHRNALSTLADWVFMFIGAMLALALATVLGYAGFHHYEQYNKRQEYERNLKLQQTWDQEYQTLLDSQRAKLQEMETTIKDMEARRDALLAAVGHRE